MDQEKKHDIALMRYGAIFPLVIGLSDEYKSNEAFFRDVSMRGVTMPDGTIKYFAPGTVKSWYLNVVWPGNIDQELLKPLI